MNKRFSHILLLLVPCLLLLGCESQPPRQDVIEKIENVVEEAIITNQQKEAIPEDISKALIPTINLDTSKVPVIEDNQRFDISVNNVPADQFFLSLVDGTEYNMVIHPEVTGSLTLNLKNVTIPEILEAARDVYGFEFIGTAYGFQVLPGRLRARIYQINYINIQRTGTSSTQVSSGSLTQSSGNASRSGNEVTPEAPRSTALGSQILTEQPKNTFWTELRDSIQAIVGTGEGRSVVVNPQSGVVVARALPNELREVEAFLSATQLIVQRQVILEAKIIEVILKEDFQSGINWGALLTPGNDQIKVANIGGGSILNNELGSSAIAGNLGSLDPDNLNFNTLTAATALAFGGVFTLGLQIGDFAAFIELLETQGNVQVLSSPRIATLNNQKAVIKVGTDEFFVTDVTNTTVTGTTTTVTPSVTLTPFFSGIALDVTPQISQDGYVTLHVHPSISEVVDQQKTVTIGTLTQDLPLALSTVRESDSIVRARSGQVIVIGGIMQDITDNREASAPVLGDLPIFGNIFKHSKKRFVKSELVILLKPIVVDSDDQWAGALGESADSLKRLRNIMNEPPAKTFLDDLFKPMEE